jgi:hypothetical protein
MAGDVIRARRIELVDDQGNLTGFLDGGETEEGERGFAALVLFGVEGETASMYGFTNRMSLACGMIPNEEYHALAR